MIWRRICVPGSTSLAQLHHVIQVAYAWDDDHLHKFHIYGKDYGIWYEGGISFSDNPHRVYLDDFEFDAGDKFVYEYNFSDYWVVDIRIEKIEEEGKEPLIRCLKGNGLQGINKYDEADAKLKLLKALANANKSATLEDLQPYIDAVHSTRFDRKQINQDLQSTLGAL